MAHPLRIHLPGGWNHSASRNSGAAAIYHDDDQCRFLEIASEPSERSGAEIHGGTRTTRMGG